MWLIKNSRGYLGTLWSEWSQELLLLIPSDFHSAVVFIWDGPWVSKPAEQAGDFQSIPDIEQSLHYPFLLLFACHTVLKPEIFLLSWSLSKSSRARAVSTCLSIQVQAQQVPVLVIACKCYYRIPGNNGKKDEVIPSSCPIYSPSMEVSLFPSPRAQEICWVSLDTNLESSAFIPPPLLSFDKTGSCQIYQRNISPLWSVSAQETGDDIHSQGTEQSLG